MAIIAATTRPREIRDFLVTLGESSQEEITVETSGHGVLAQVKANPPRLVVIDQTLPDFDSLELVVKVMMVSAMTHTAVVTDMTSKEFHDASEGYGVLMALPTEPSEEDGRKLSEALGRM